MIKALQRAFLITYEGERTGLSAGLFLKWYSADGEWEACLWNHFCQTALSSFCSLSYHVSGAGFRMWLVSLVCWKLPSLGLKAITFSEKSSKHILFLLMFVTFPTPFSFCLMSKKPRYLLLFFPASYLLPVFSVLSWQAEISVVDQRKPFVMDYGISLHSTRRQKLCEELGAELEIKR